MATTLKRRNEYAHAVQDMSWTAQARTRAAEKQLQRLGNRVDAIIAGVFTRRTVWLWQYRDIALYFHFPEPTTISLDLALDLRNLPTWFIEPAGDWFEKYAEHFDQSWDIDLVE
jgi:hypothetical protein